jgi:hypothetical protein
MESWKVVVEAQRSGMDLRDPKIVTFGSAVMVFCGGAVPMPQANR